MSKVLRLPLVLILALVMALAWALPATADPATPTAEECLETPDLAGCAPGDSVVPGDGAAGGSSGGELGGTGSDDAESLDAVPALALVVVPNCDDLPSDVLPPCEAPICADPATETLPLCQPAGPAEPDCENLPELPGLDFCQDPDPDCPEPPVDPAAAAAVADETDGECTPPITCDQFAQLFGFGDSCEDIPLCIPRDRVPAGFPIPIPSPPLCPGPPAGGTPPTTDPPAHQPGQQHEQPVYYENCDDARAKGKAPVHATDAGYREGLDSDHDGVGCEETAAYVAAPVNTQGAGKLAYTGVDLELWLRAVAILVSSGTLLILAGVRRRT